MACNAGALAARPGSLAATGWPAGPYATNRAPERLCILARMPSVKGKLDPPSASTTPLNRSTICRSVRRAAKAIEAIVMAAIERVWIATIGTRTCCRIDQRMRPLF